MSLQEKQEEPIQQIFNVNNDAEFEALLTACVQAAGKRNMKRTELNQMISYIWERDQEIFEEINEMKKRRLKMDMTETEEQKIFRQKAKKCLQEYPQMIISGHLDWIKSYPDYPFDYHYLSSFPYEDSVTFFAPITEQDFVLELFCAIYKMYSETQEIGFVTLKKYVRTYLQYVFEERAELRSYQIVEYYFGTHQREGKNLISNIDNFYLASNGVVEKYKPTITGKEIVISGTDLTIRPTYGRKDEESKKMFSLFRAKEWRDMREKQFPFKPANRTRDFVVKLIWFIENFF